MRRERGTGGEGGCRQYNEGVRVATYGGSSTTGINCCHSIRTPATGKTQKQCEGKVLYAQCTIGTAVTNARNTAIVRGVDREPRGHIERSARRFERVACARGKTQTASTPSRALQLVWSRSVIFVEGKFRLLG